MDSRIGLDYIVENAEYTTKLGAGKCQKCSYCYQHFDLTKINQSLKKNILLLLKISLKNEVIMAE